MSQAPNPTTRRRPGRPPSDAARARVLETAYRIVMSDGLGRLSIERVATEAGVGKQTIYRSWSNAQELAMAAFMAQPAQEPQAPRSRSARNRLKALLRGVIEAFATTRGRQVTLTMASADPESELAKAFRNQVILKSREAGRRWLDEAMAAHEIRSDVPVEAVLDMLYGPLFFRLLVGHQPLTEKLSDQLVDTLFDGLMRLPSTTTAAER